MQPSTSPSTSPEMKALSALDNPKLMPLDQRVGSPPPRLETPMAPVPDFSKTIPPDQRMGMVPDKLVAPDVLEKQFGPALTPVQTATEVRAKAKEVLKEIKVPVVSKEVAKDPAKELEAKAEAAKERDAKAKTLVEQVRKKVPEAVAKSIPPAEVPEGKGYFDSVINWFKDLWVILKPNPKPKKEEAPKKAEEPKKEVLKAELTDKERVQKFFSDPETLRRALVKHELIKDEVKITVTEAGQLALQIRDALVEAKKSQKTGLKADTKMEAWDKLIGTEFSTRVNLIDALLEEVFGIKKKA